jgi:hypothetical protein
LRYAVIAVLIVGGFWGGTSNALRSRTQAFQVRNAIEANGEPGDPRGFETCDEVRPFLTSSGECCGRRDDELARSDAMQMVWRCRQASAAHAPPHPAGTRGDEGTTEGE